MLVDGRFVEAEYDISLRFRGSRNQRLLDVPKSLAAGQPVWWQDEKSILHPYDGIINKKAQIFHESRGSSWKICAFSYSLLPTISSMARRKAMP